MTGPNPLDRSKPGAKPPVLTDAAALPLAVSAANIHDSLALIPLVQAIPAIRSRRGPRRRRPGKLHADKGYDYDHLRAWLRWRGITPRIARRGIETSDKLGRHRWIIERSLAWLAGYRRLTLRYERSARLSAPTLTNSQGSYPINVSHAPCAVLKPDEQPGDLRRPPSIRRSFAPPALQPREATRKPVDYSRGCPEAS